MMDPSVTLNRCETALSDFLRTAFTTAFPAELGEMGTPKVVPTTNPEFGDFQCNDAMAISKQLRMNPRQLAEKVLQSLPLPGMIAKAEIAGPGFINITVSADWLAEQTVILAAAPHFGIPKLGEGKTVILDYSSPNVAKPMHIGHIRSTVIGNALDRLFRVQGYNVIADNHLGDWGTQFGILIIGYREFLTDAERADLTVELLERVYVQSYNRTKEDPTWMDRCRTELVKLQQGDAANLAVWKRFIEISIQEFNRVYKRLDVSFDLYRGESYYNPILPQTIELLQNKGLAVESEGALIVDLKDEGLQVCIVRKSDGGFNYTATDIATVRSRVEEFKPDRIIYVTDERQQLHFKQFFNICGKLGYGTRLEHVWFGLMRLPEGTFSTRQGNVIKLEALLDEAEARALAVVKESNPGMPEADQQKLAADIGISAVKYADLSHDPQGMIVFSWDKALALDGNSGPYLQYAYARMCSLLEKYAAQVGKNPAGNALRLESAVEKQLALQLLQFPSAVVRASESSKPSVLADYLYTLCKSYSSFYQNSPVLKAEPEVRDSRIRLCCMVSQTLREGLTLLGLRTPERI